MYRDGSLRKTKDAENKMELKTMKNLKSNIKIILNSILNLIVITSVTP